MKYQFQKMLTNINKAIEVFEANKSLFNSIGIMNPSDLINGAKNNIFVNYIDGLWITNNEFLDFIKVE